MICRPSFETGPIGSGLGPSQLCEKQTRPIIVPKLSFSKKMNLNAESGFFGETFAKVKV